MSGTTMSASGSTGVPWMMRTRGSRCASFVCTGSTVLDGPAGDADSVGRLVVDDLLGPLAADEHCDELAACGVGLVDHELVVGHQRADGVGDALEECVEALLGEHLAEDVGQAAIGLDERIRARERVGPFHRRETDPRGCRAPCSVLGPAHRSNLFFPAVKGVTDRRIQKHRTARVSPNPPSE